MDGNKPVKLRTERRQHWFTSLKEERRQGHDKRDNGAKTENEYYNTLWQRKLP